MSRFMRGRWRSNDLGEAVLGMLQAVAVWALVVPPEEPGGEHRRGRRR